MKKRSEIGDLSNEYVRISEVILDINPWEVYSKVEADLYIGDERADYMTLMKHMDYAETNARNAYRLYLSARLERERYEKQIEPVKSDIWRRSIIAVQNEREKWPVKKQVTDTDVRSYISVVFAKEIREMDEKLSSLKVTEDYLELLSDLAKSRCKSLQTMLFALRK